MEPIGFKMKLKITASQKDLEVEIKPGVTLEELKQECCKVIGEFTEIKLIYRGKILRDSDDLSILKEGQTLYLVKDQKKPADSPAPAAISSGAGNMAGLLHGLNHFGVMNQATNMLNELDSIESSGELESGIDPNQMAMISQMMSNPGTRDFMLNFMQQLLSNPQMRDSLVNSNPALKRLIQSNPGALDAMSNPMVMEQMKSMMERMSLGNTSGPLSGDVSSFPSPGGGPTPPANPNNPQNLSPGLNPFAQMFAGLGGNQPNPVLSQPPNNPSLNPTPPLNPLGMYNPMFNMFQNPYTQPVPPNNPYTQLGQGNNLYANPYAGFLNNFYPQNSVNPSQNLREVYSVQLQKMKDMGFINEESNIKALQAASGDVNVAIERLLNMLG